MMRFAPLLLLSAAPLAAQQGVTFRFTPPVGQVSVYRITTTSDVELGTGSRMSVEQMMYMTQRVTARERDVSTVEVTIDSVSMTTSAGVPGPGPGERLQGMKSTMRIDALGRLVDIQYEDSTLQRVAAAFAGQLTGGSPGQVLFAERPIAPGATWSDTGTTTISMEQGRMELRRDLTYRLERLEARGRARVAVISVTGTLEQAMSLADGQGIPAMTSRGAVRGQVSFDLDASRWADHEMVMTMVTESPMMPAPMQMTMTVQGELVGQN